jgi:hypothetical protein
MSTSQQEKVLHRTQLLLRRGVKGRLKLSHPSFCNSRSKSRNSSSGMHSVIRILEAEVVPSRSTKTVESLIPPTICIAPLRPSIILGALDLDL